MSPPRPEAHKNPKQQHYQYGDYQSIFDPF